MTVGQLLAKNTAFMFAGEVISRLLSFLLIIVIARSLGDSMLGLYSFAFAFAGLLFTFSDFGLSTMMLKEVGRAKEKAEYYLSNVMTLKAILLFAMTIIGVLFITATAKSFETMLVVSMLAIAMFFNFLTEPLKAIFTAFEKVHFYSAVIIAERLVAVSAGMYVLLSGKGLAALMAVFIASYFLAFALALALVWKNFSRFAISFNAKEWLKIVKKAMPFWFTLLFMTLYYRTDTVMLSLMTNFAVVGWYNAAYKMMEGLSFVPLVLVSVAFPVMSNFYAKSDDLLKVIYKRIFYYLFLLALPIGIGATLLADRLITFFYGGGLTGNLLANAPIALQILIWAEALVFVNYATGYLLNSIDKQKLFTYVTGFYAIANVVLNYILIPKFSYIGAAAATVATQTGVFLTLSYLAGKEGYGINLAALLWKPVIAAAVMAVLIYFFGGLHLALLVPLAAAAYFAISFLLKGFGKEELELAKSFMKRE